MTKTDMYKNEVELSARVCYNLSAAAEYFLCTGYKYMHL